MKAGDRCIAITLLLFVVSGCGPDGPARPGMESAPQAADTALHIQWRTGDVEAAFAEARAQNKPIFLYWGAESCPPCHQIKVTVFSKYAFIERSRSFIPVYLDGDTGQAQKYAARFGVMGYPTMVVFSPQGRELTRIPGGLDIDAYASVLDLTLSDIRPVVELVESAMGGTALAADDCRLLAYYSWEQDNEGILTAHAPAILFPALAEACPSGLAAERSRLFMEYLAAVTDDSIDAAGLADDDIAEALARFQGILSDPVLTRANLVNLLDRGADIVAVLTTAGTAERATLRQQLLEVLDELAADESLPKRERIYTSRTKVLLERIDDPDGSISTALRDEIMERVAWADRTTPDVYERHTVMNAASNTLVDAGLYDAARALLDAEIEISNQPYYFMLSRAELEEEAGQGEAALAWFQRAYAASKGPATRFQWGYNYLEALLNYSPDDEERITRETLRVFSELRGVAAGAFYQRTRLRMQRLQRSFANWNAGGRHDASIAAIRSGLAPICAAIPAGESSRKTCEGFLAT